MSQPSYPGGGDKITVDPRLKPSKIQRTVRPFKTVIRKVTRKGK